jgi:hypothetical protein
MGIVALSKVPLIDHDVYPVLREALGEFKDPLLVSGARPAIRDEKIRRGSHRIEGG